MARRRRSYGAGKDNTAVFINNCIAAHQKRKRAEEKAAAAASRRYARERDMAARRRAKEAEQAQKKAAREAERQRKVQLKLQEKEAKVAAKLKLDFELAGLYPGERTIAEIATKAVEGSVTPAQAKKYFLIGKEETLAEPCAVEYLEQIGIDAQYHDLKPCKAMRHIVTSLRPQTDADKDPDFIKLKAESDIRIKEKIAKARRADEKHKLLGMLIKTKSMFSDEIEEFAEIIESKDWGRSQCEKSSEYQERIKNKADYVAQVKAQIRPIKLAVAS